PLPRHHPVLPRRRSVVCSARLGGPSLVCPRRGTLEAGRARARRIAIAIRCALYLDDMKTSVTRALVVTLALALTGAVCGGILGGLALLIDVARSPAVLELRDVAIAFAVGGAWGAVFGVVLAPLFAWLLLRRVSLGRAILQTALGTTAGLLVGALAAPN